MKIEKFLFVAALTFVLSLLYFLVSSQNPLDRKYEEIVKKILEDPRLKTETDAVTHYPELQELKVQIREVKKMQYDIRQITLHPIPPDEREHPLLIKKIAQLKNTKKEVKLKMNEFLTRNSRTVSL